MSKTVKETVASTVASTVVNTVDAPVKEQFTKRCVAVKTPGVKTFKVVCEDGNSVSVPPAYRDSMVEGQIVTLTLELAAGGKFYKAVGLNAPKKATRKTAVNASVKAALAIFAEADTKAETETAE